MSSGPSGQVYIGVTFPPYTYHGDSNVYIGCTFNAPNYFGKSNTFVNSVFMCCCYPYYNNPWSEVGDAGTFDTVTFNCVYTGNYSHITNGIFGLWSPGILPEIEFPGMQNGWGLPKTVSHAGGITTEGEDMVWSCQVDYEIRQQGYKILNRTGEIIKGFGIPTISRVKPDSGVTGCR